MCWKSFIFIVLIAIGFGCAGDSRELTNALHSITAEDLSADVQVLSSDEFEGRKPSSPGEEKTISFLKNEFQKLGLQPGNGLRDRRRYLYEFYGEYEAEVCRHHDHLDQQFSNGIARCHQRQGSRPTGQYHQRWQRLPTIAHR